MSKAVGDSTTYTVDTRCTCVHCGTHARHGRPLELQPEGWLCPRCFDETRLCRYGCDDFCAQYPECCDGGD